MSDFRSPRDPLYRDRNDRAYGTGYAPAAGRANNWGWIAAALCMAVILVITLAVGHEPNRVASTNMAPPTAFHPLAPAPNRP
jgi:hypothetical protein